MADGGLVDHLTTAQHVRPTFDVDRLDPARRQWTVEAIRTVRAEMDRSAETPLLRFPLPPEWGIDLYLKDESASATGSLKHRLAGALFLDGLCSGRLLPSNPVIEASSGSTAVSEAYFAALIGVPFLAVVPSSTSGRKRELIEQHGGRCHLVDTPEQAEGAAVALAAASGGYFLDQFRNAERVTDWRGHNLAESLFGQLRRERHAEPAWVVATAGTGSTATVLGRHIRYHGLDTGLCVADPEDSCLFEGWLRHDPAVTHGRPSRIEGIGRPRMEPSFVTEVVDRMMRVPDAASLGAVRVLSRRTGRRAGGSTGTGLWAALRLVAEMRSTGRRGSVATILCDSGDRYADTQWSAGWLAENDLDPAPYEHSIDSFLATGEMP